MGKDARRPGSLGAGAEVVTQAEQKDEDQEARQAQRLFYLESHDALVKSTLLLFPN